VGGKTADAWSELPWLSYLLGILRPMHGELTPDQRADRLASRQYAAISRSQALDVGLTSHQIDERVDSGRWHRSVRGVYVVAGAPALWQQPVMVAVLAGPPGTVASHLTAAALFGLTTPPALPHVTVPPKTSGRFGRAQVHWSTLAENDICVVAEIPCTRPARTLVDCAALLGYGPLCGLVDEAFCRALTDPRAVRAAAARASRAPGRRGLPLLEQALGIWTPGPRPTRGEARVLRRLEEWGLPQPQRQFKVRDRKGRFVARVDFAWPALRLILEYDGQRFHGPRQEEHDARRQEHIESLGWRVERADKRDLRPSSTSLRNLLTTLLLDQAA
jgi:Protein of unknown function (DUF559)